MSKVLIGVTTYLKNDALKVLINSLIKYNYLQGENHLVISDDGNGVAEGVYKEFLPILSHKIHYLSHPRGGIWRNKNYILEFFFKNSFDYLFSCDDDIELTNPGLLEEMINAMNNGKIGHLTTFLSDFSCSLDPKINGFFDEFPIIMEDEFIAYTGGCQGIGVMYERKAIEKIGYYTHFPGVYGGEHSNYSARLNKIEGRFPTLFPLFKRSGRFIRTQQIPNNYHDHQQGIDVNMPFYHKQLERIFRGYDLVVPTPGKEGKRK